MKNTQTTSIGGIVFHVEEDAHQKLSKYLADISASLTGSEGHKEIMNDIEARIAEILQPKVKGYKQVVTIEDVDEVIGIMGNANEFGEAGSKSQSTANPHEYVRKRVFRDPDDKVIFGVCAGLGHYFGIDPLWIRLAWALSVFIFGFGVLLYIILAIIMPKAVTAAEKLEMKGEPVDINNIKRRVEEELDYLKGKMNNLKDDFKKGGKRTKGDFGRRVGDLASDLGDGAVGVFGVIFKGIAMFFGFLMVFVCSVLLIALLVSLFSGINVVHIHAQNGHWIHYTLHDIFSLFALSDTSRVMVITGVALFLGVPLLAIIIRVGRSVLGYKGRSRVIRFVLGLLWLVSWGLIIGGTINTFGHFSVTGAVKDEVNFSVPSNTLHISMPNKDEQDVSVRIDSLNFYISDNNLFQGNPSLCIEKSEDTLFHLEIMKHARGITNAEAMDAAKNINYTFAQHDSTLALDPYFELEPGTPWRKQKLELLLKVPAKKMIQLPEGVDNIMCSTIHKQFHHTGGKKLMMKDDGGLIINN